MAKVLDCGLEVSNLEFQLSYYIHFWTVVCSIFVICLAKYLIIDSILLAALL